MTAFLASCGIDLIDPGKDGDTDGGTDTFQNTGDPCLPSYDGPDSDGDGLSDECEDIIGSNKNNQDTDGDGINDSGDIPNDRDGDGVEEGDLEDEPAWWQAFVNQLISKNATGTTLATQFLNKNPPAGSIVNIYHQEVRFIIEGNYGDPSGAEILNFCRKKDSTHRNFLYFYVRGDVQFCPTCIRKNDVMEFCGELDNHLTLANFEQGQKIDVEDFTWHVGKVLEGTIFNPEVLTKRGKSDSTSITIIPRDSQDDNNGRTFFRKATVKFKSTFSIKGQATNTDGGDSSGVFVQTPGRVEAEKRYTRSVNSQMAPENISMIGAFENTGEGPSETDPTTP